MCDLVATNSMLDFLIYSYFGITFKNDSKEILKAAAKRGYNDATMRGALVFKKKFNKNIDDSKYISEYNKCEKKRAAIRYVGKINAVNLVIESFNKLKKSVDFNIWHKELCDTLVKTVNDNYYNLLKENCNELYNLEENHQRYFTYGNAQKFVNMFLKNLYVLTVISSLYKEDENAKTWHNEYEWIIDKSKDFHIPLDSYIGVLSWSTIDNYDEYSEKRNQTKLSFSNENESWIEKAKEATQKDALSKLRSFFKLLANNKDIQQELKKYGINEDK